MDQRLKEIFDGMEKLKNSMGGGEKWERYKLKKAQEEDDKVYIKMEDPELEKLLRRYHELDDL